ncbi:MAG: hypothetical protein A2077_06560 [Nitrospirae bacterium GWC2_46_6]|nr:MAG: hypothetical protein A2Z82_07935 [Nitrospirae bacterium GWA2_46_11]OGW22106.1 MAG: hypothetical protein A2077_06560 [Nitrospirae bacterium GWC2_46_6]OGW25769.1 MAG: hypothetical protein A2X55_01635 [Nitrospirae bacterium GWB2_47_37]HAK89593.1 hypothetical protein [Nitrospiraceae bacterium]HCL81885.1 hypothetical protein [Nitrospiraceae bacterium]
MDGGLNNLKKHVFFELLNLAGRAFVLVGYSDDVLLGNRRFTAEEKENGIILVFNSKMNFMWDDYGITATLVFGTSPQKCFVPADAIRAVYSPELNAQFTVSPQPKAVGGQSERLSTKTRIGQPTVGALKTKPRKQEGSVMKSAAKKNVIQVDFTKKTKR